MNSRRCYLNFCAYLINSIRYCIAFLAGDYLTVFNRIGYIARLKAGRRSCLCIYDSCAVFSGNTSYLCANESIYENKVDLCSTVSGDLARDSYVCTIFNAEIQIAGYCDRTDSCIGHEVKCSIIFSCCCNIAKIDALCAVIINKC